MEYIASYGCFSFLSLRTDEKCLDNNKNKKTQRILNIQWTSEQMNVVFFLLY